MSTTSASPDSTKPRAAPHRKIEPPDVRKPRLRGALQCAREDSNLHGPNGPQGPQPPPCWTLADTTDSFARCGADSWTGWTLLDGVDVVTVLSRAALVKAGTA